MPSVLVVGEVENGALAPVTDELLAAAEKVAPSTRPMLALVADSAQGLAEAGSASGAGRVCLMVHPALAGGGAGVFDAPVAALEKLIGTIEPEIVLFGRTDFGANVAPRVAIRLGAAVASDCIDLAVDAASGRLKVTRPVYGGNALALFEFGPQNPQIAVIRPRVFEPGNAVAAADCVVEEFDVSDVVREPRARVADTVPEDRSGVRLEDAEAVVAGGRGLGGPAAFDLLRELASLLHGAVGATRAACDAEWIDHSCQIGLTGKTIGPRVYIAVGISGASQHMAGCSGAKTLVAVNRDPDANIFKNARYGAVGEWEQVLPAFVAAVRDLDRDQRPAEFRQGP